MKILQASYNHKPYIGGIETYSNELEKYLKESDYTCYFITNSYSKFKILRIFKIFLKTISKLFTNKIEVAHLTNINLWPVVLVNYFKKNKIVFFINLHGLELVFGKRKKIISKIYNILVPYKFINKLTNLYFFSNSKETLKLAEKKLDKTKIKYIPMGVSKCMKLKNNESVNFNQFFYLGRITKRKGINWFVEEVLPYFPDKKLLIGGPIADIKEFEAISKSEQVDYLGVLDQKEIIELHRRSFLTIFPNFRNNNELDFEGFGISFLEAISNGGLPITTVYQGLKSATLDGQIGICMQDNLASNWFSKIEEIASQGLSYRKKIIEDSQQLINNNFLWEDIFERTTIEYKKVFQ